MSGDTWVALDGRDPDTFHWTCWISDVGPYTGPNPAAMLASATWVPAAARFVTLIIVPPNPDGHDDHVLGSGAYAYTVGDDYEQRYSPAPSMSEFGDPTTLDASPHLFVMWDVPGATGSTDPATLTAPTASPLDMTPVGWASGGRLAASSGIGPADLAALSFGLYDVDGTWIGPLTDVQAGSWQHELSAPGSLTCRVALDDPFAAALTPKRIVKAFWRGAARMAARIDSSAVDLAVDGRRWREFNQIPGALNMLADGIVYPDDLNWSSSGQRWFGYMSKTLTGGNFTTALGYTYNSDTTNKKGKPDGLTYPNPWWIAKRGPTNIEPAGQVQIFRTTFTTSVNKPYQILATADDFLTLWLDGEKLYESDQQTAKEWTFLQQITGTLPAGTHTLAAKVVNAKGFVNNPIAFIMTLQEIDSSGNVVLGTPIVDTDASWTIADDNPGYHRGGVLAALHAEAAARSVQAFGVLTLGFSTTQDSTSTNFADTPGEYAVDVKSTVLDVVEQITSAQEDLDVDVDFGTLTFNAYNRRGSDLSGTVALVVGGSLKQDRVERVEAKFNTALIQKSDGSYIEVADSASVTAYGRIETGLELGSTSDTGTAQSTAQGAFTENADTAYTFTVTASSLTGPQVYVDFNVGDSITLTDDEGTTRKVRVIAVSIDASNEVPDVTFEVAVDRS